MHDEHFSLIKLVTSALLLYLLAHINSDLFLGYLYIHAWWAHWKAGGASKEAEEETGVMVPRCGDEAPKLTPAVAKKPPEVGVSAPETFRVFREILRDVLRAINDENGAVV